MPLGSDIDLVIFDCDGTLVETERIGVGIDQQILAELGWALSIEEIAAHFMGQTHEHFTQTIERELGITLAADWRSRYQPRYRTAYKQDLTPVDGAPELLASLPVPFCVASNSTHEALRFSLGLTGLLEKVDGRIFSADDVENGKPAPDIYLLAAKTMGVPPSRCLVVEDSVFGVRAGRAAGMRVLGYTGGLTVPDRLEAEGAEPITHLSEVLALVTGTGASASVAR